MDNQNLKKKNIILVFLTEFIRIKGTINWTLISFIGFILGISSLKISNYIIPLFVFFISTLCIISFTFSINNYYDADSDRNNPRRKDINAIASGKISRKTSIFLNLSFIIIPLIVSILFKFEVFLFCVLLIFWMWIYSSPPLRLKGRPGIDVIWHFFAFLLLVLWGSIIAGSINNINLLVAISFGIWSCIAQVWNHIDDFSFDKESGTKTYAVWVGLDNAKKTLKIIVIIQTIFLIPLILLFALNYLFTIVILILGGIFVLVLIKPKKDFPISSIYYKTFVFAGVVYLCCIFYHILAILDNPTIDLFFLEMF